LNSSHKALLKSLVSILLTTVLQVSPVNAQEAQKPNPTEQASFGAEINFDRPAHLNAAAKKVLATQEIVADELDSNHLTVESMPDAWFSASEIHLGGKNEVDLVVMGIDRLMGADIDSFWVLRQTPKGYDVVLSTVALDLNIVNSRTNGLRDVQASAVVRGYGVTDKFQFDGHSYQVARRTTDLAGEELPRDLSKYETMKPLVQLPNQEAAPVLAQARAWIWGHLEAEKLSYLKVTTRGETGEGETRTFFINKSETGEWRAIIKTHRIVWDQDSPSIPRRKIVEDIVMSADLVERIDPSSDSDSPEVLSGNEALSPEKYRLLFIDRDSPIDTL